VLSFQQPKECLLQQHRSRRSVLTTVLFNYCSYILRILTVENVQIESTQKYSLIEKRNYTFNNMHVPREKVIKLTQRS